jgi:phosphatidate cytidylyltransferase
VLAAVALACVYVGGWAWTVAVALVAAVLSWEWAGMCSAGALPGPRRAPLGAAGTLAMASAPAGVLATAAAGGWAGLGVLAAGAAATLAASATMGAERPLWRAAGVLYVGAPCAAIVWLRARPDAGLEAVVWLLALVWATDVAAYAAGRRIGGPRLAPAISPGKTWAGLGGGVAAAALVGALAAIWLDLPSIWPLLAISAGLAVIEQLGDLGESAVKRRFGVKDSSAIIPGHGGFLDRVDGLMAVAVAVAVLTLVADGSVLRWQ